MDVNLPLPVAAYFQAANAHDSRLLSNSFAQDAIVQDEGNEYRGLAAIMDWSETTSKNYALTLEVRSVTEQEGQLVVTAQASGNFQGSPAAIDFRFTLENQKITFLRCG